MTAAEDPPTTVSEAPSTQSSFVDDDLPWTFGSQIRVPIAKQVKALELLCQVPREDWGKDSRKYIREQTTRKPNCLVFGLANHKCARGLTVAGATTKHPELFDVLLSIGKEWPDKDLKWTSIHVLEDFKTEPHIDAMNLEPALQVTLGDFDGGELGLMW
eukprot:2473476-Alexandrium_andersonii.AAC.1